MLIVILIIFSFFQITFSKDPSRDQAQKLLIGQQAQEVLNRIKYELPSPSIIGEREWKELQLDRLVNILDRTKTSFGRWGLAQLLHPIADKKELERRKEIITFLIEHEDEMRIFQEQLERVKAGEKSLLAYWDKHDLLNEKSRQFYFSSFGLTGLNKSSIALNASTAMEMFTSTKYLLFSLALGGLYTEFQRWLLSEKENIDIPGGIKEGFKEPLKQHSLTPAIVDISGEKIPVIDPHKKVYDYKDYIRAYALGSWRDRYNVSYRGYEIDFQKLGIPEYISFLGFRIPIPLPKQLSTSSGILGSILVASIPTLFYDYQKGNTIFSIGKQIVSMYRTLDGLQQRVCHVAQCIDAIKELQEMVTKQAPTLRSYLADTDEYEDQRNVLIKKLLVPRFLKKSDYIYSRGHVLTMHREIALEKKALIPLLHSVALLDAYCSIAQLYKESQNKAVVFSFAEFVESENPFLDYKDAWLPLLPYDQAVTNNLALGVANKSSKIVITGPNGGGKSTILKALGMAILPQSWCIAPARQARQTLFSSIRTALSPREDLEHGLSTFMAEKKTMAEIYEDIVKAAPYHHMLVLIDEPYKGTVDAESAKRIYQFGKDIARYPQALVAIATHVRKPIELAQDTNGIFGNYQVKINEIAYGVFERLFKLIEGPAMWWFEDDGKRSRFVDWISVKGDSSEEKQ